MTGRRRSGQARLLAVASALTLGMALVMAAVISSSAGAATARQQATSAGQMAAQPGLELTKTPASLHFGAAGDYITYMYTVTATGLSEATGSLIHLTVTDTRASHVACDTDELTTGDPTAHCIAVYQATEVDVATGSIDNTACATARDTTGPPVYSNCASATVTLLRAAALTLTKNTTAISFAGPNERIEYTYTVTNTGDVPVSDVEIRDSKVSGVCHFGVIDVGSPPRECHGSYTTTAADVAAGEVMNRAFADGEANDRPVMSNLVNRIVPLAEQPALELTKVPSTDTFSAAGQHITYTYTVSNTGNVPLTDVQVHDSTFGLNVCDHPISLAVDGIAVCTHTYTTTSTDVANREVADSATATGEHGVPGVAGSGTVESSDDAIVSLLAEPAVAVTKSPDISSFAVAGTPVAYTYEVTNTGSVPLHDVRVTDSRLGLVCVLHADLLSHATARCEAATTTSAADVAAGRVRNVAVVTGVTPAGGTVRAEAFARIDLVRAPRVSITKTADITSFSSAGTPVTFTYHVENNGNVPLTGIFVSDSLGITVICPSTTLAVRGQMQCGASYVTTQADVRRGRVFDIARVSSRDPAGAQITGQASDSISVEHRPAISIGKTASTLSFSSAGSTVTYFYEVTNTGSVTLHAVAVTDSRLGPISCPQPTLAPGERMICTATHVITAGEVGQRSLSNTASVTGQTPDGKQIDAVSADVLLNTPAPGPVVPVTVTG